MFSVNGGPSSLAEFWNRYFYVLFPETGGYSAGNPEKVFLCDSMCQNCTACWTRLSNSYPATKTVVSESACEAAGTSESDYILLGALS